MFTKKFLITCLGAIITHLRLTTHCGRYSSMIKSLWLTHQAERSLIVESPTRGMSISLVNIIEATISIQLIRHCPFWWLNLSFFESPHTYFTSRGNLSVGFYYFLASYVNEFSIPIIKAYRKKTSLYNWHATMMIVTTFHPL